jgi:TRAP-type C4-dicarboxylate transport system permease small subunit
VYETCVYRTRIYASILKIIVYLFCVDTSWYTWKEKHTSYSENERVANWHVIDWTESWLFEKKSIPYVSKYLSLLTFFWSLTIRFIKKNYYKYVKR